MKSYSCVCLFINAAFACMLGSLVTEEACTEFHGGEKYSTVGLVRKSTRFKSH